MKETRRRDFFSPRERVSRLGLGVWKTFGERVDFAREILADEGELPPRCRRHFLRGNLAGARIGF